MVCECTAFLSRYLVYCKKIKRPEPKCRNGSSSRLKCPSQSLIVAKGKWVKEAQKGGRGAKAPLEYFRRFHHWRKLYNVSRQSLHAMPQYIRSLHEWRRIAREDDSGGSHPHGLGLLGGHRTSDHRSSNETTGGFDSRLGRVILGNNKI